MKETVGEIMKVGEVLGQMINQGKVLDLKNWNNGLIYAADAREEGYEFCIPEPEPETCGFCGKELFYRGVKHLSRKAVFRWLQPGRCDCSEAQKHWAQQDAERDRIKKEKAELECRKKLSVKVEKLFRQSRMGERFKTRTFENFKVNESNRKAYDASKKYADKFDSYRKEGVGLIYTGSYGTGKTHLAAAIAIQLMKNGMPVIFGTLISLLGKLKETYNGNGDEAKVLELYRNVDLLVVDDLGKERPTEWVLEKLYSIINERYENNRPVVITSNYNNETLTERLKVKQNTETAEAIVSRLYEMCRGVCLNGEDYRKL